MPKNTKGSKNSKDSKSSKGSKSSKDFSDRSKKLHRLLSILRMLENREKCTADILAAKFSTNVRTIYRDMTDLDYSGFKVRNKEPIYLSIPTLRLGI